MMLFPLVAPKHKDVATTLESKYPAFATIVRNACQSENCWGDLILVGQKELSPADGADVLKILADNGWKRNIITAWCPLTKKLWAEYLEARDLKGKYANSEDRARRYRERTIYGTVGLIRDLWKQIRQKWMQDQSLKNDRDSVFFEKIISYLEGKYEQKNNIRNG
jgi:hypothetical protein